MARIERGVVLAVDRSGGFLVLPVVAGRLCGTRTQTRRVGEQSHLVAERDGSGIGVHHECDNRRGEVREDKHADDEAEQRVDERRCGERHEVLANARQVHNRKVKGAQVPPQHVALLEVHGRRQPLGLADLCHHLGEIAVVPIGRAAAVCGDGHLGHDDRPVTTSDVVREHNIREEKRQQFAQRRLQVEDRRANLQWRGGRIG
eukprot:384403-Prymnesium_polylepis.1